MSLALLGTALAATRSIPSAAASPRSAGSTSPPPVAARYSYVRTGTIGLPVGAVTIGLDPMVHHGFVLTGTGDQTAVVGIDLRNGKQISRVVVPFLRHGVGAIDTRTHQLLVFDGEFVQLVDTRTGRLLHPDSPIRFSETVTSATWDPVGGRFWLTAVDFDEHRPNSVVIGLDPTTGSMIDTSEGERPETAYVYQSSAPDTARDRVLVVDSEDYGLKVLSISTGQQVGKRIVGDYGGLGDVNTRTGSAYASLRSHTGPFEFRLVRVSTTTGAITAEIGHGLYGGESLDQAQSLLYAERHARPGSTESVVDVLDESSLTVLATLPTDGGPLVDTVSHDVYVVNTGYGVDHPSVTRYSERPVSGD